MAGDTVGDHAWVGYWFGFWYCNVAVAAGNIKNSSAIRATAYFWILAGGRRAIVSAGSNHVFYGNERSVVSCFECSQKNENRGLLKEGLQRI